MGWCRGQLSEGIDFANEQARLVIVIGYPNPAWRAPEVVLKKQFLDSQRNSHFTGDQWYEQQAPRAVNQAVGRVIRHRYDYGAIVLMDHRYLVQPKTTSNLSGWLQP